MSHFWKGLFYYALTEKNTNSPFFDVWIELFYFINMKPKYWIAIWHALVPGLTAILLPGIGSLCAIPNTIPNSYSPIQFQLQ